MLCTTVGETASDDLSENIGLGLYHTSMVAGALLAVALVAQFAVKKYIPALYWIVVVLVSVFGTLITDILTDGQKFPLEYSTIIFTVLLGATFAVWYAKEGTLSIHSIYTRRREAFYWLAILFTFALGRHRRPGREEARGRLPSHRARHAPRRRSRARRRCAR